MKLARLHGVEDVRLDEDLGFSSLDRVELLAKVEQQTGRRINEESFAAVRTVADLEAALSSSAPAPKVSRRGHRAG